MLDGKGEFLARVGNFEQEITRGNDDRRLNCPVFGWLEVGGAKSREGKDGDGVRHL